MILRVNWLFLFFHPNNNLVDSNFDVPASPNYIIHASDYGILWPQHNDYSP